MPATDSITQARLKELLEYDPDTGDFIWLQRPANRVHIGDVAGSNSHGYILISIDSVTYRAHRLAFLYILGWMPEQVDHDDQVRDNNRWKNLNPATESINGKNQKLFSTNTSGYCGVYWDKQHQKWRALISVNRKPIHLGYFTEKPAAIAARQAADIKYGFNENHGGLNERSR